MPSRLFVAVALLLASAMTACVEEDTGHCCTVPPNADAGIIPIPDRPDGAVPKDIVRVNPRFNCEELTCASVQGSEPYCTRECTEDKPCPDGFECVQILQSDPGPGSSIRFGDRHCARKDCSKDGVCPSDFTCETVYAGRGTVDDPIVKQCVKAEHKCGAQ